MTRSPTLRQYVAAIDRRYSGLRGVPAALSPRDVPLVLEWYEQGVPVGLVLRVLDEIASRHAQGSTSAQPIRSLRFARRAIDKAFREHRLLAPERPAAAASGFPRERLTATLQDLGRRMAGSALASMASDIAPRAARRLAEIGAGLPEPVSLRHVEEAEKELTALDEEVLRAAWSGFPEEARLATLQAERELSDFKDGIAPAAFQASVRTRAEALLRESLHIPVTSLFYLEPA